MKELLIGLNIRNVETNEEKVLYAIQQRIRSLNYYADQQEDALIIARNGDMFVRSEKKL